VVVLGVPLTGAAPIISGRQVESILGASVQPTRRAVLDEVADVVTAIRDTGIVRVGIDGIDGAGKTMFADELADVLRHRGRTVIRASVDGFHNLARVRYRQGRHSPVGYYRDSFDYERLRDVLLNPLSPNGSRRYLTAIHDVALEEPIQIEEQVAPDGSVLVFDGVFLHRAELANYWDCSVFLDVDRGVAEDRMARRDGPPSDPSVEPSRRYVEGQRIYLETCRPTRVATIVIDNNDLDRPHVDR
jgi:uridine kinase